MNEFEKYKNDCFAKGFSFTEEMAFNAGLTTGQAAERKQNVEIARKMKDGDDYAYNNACEDIAKAIEGSE